MSLNCGCKLNSLEAYRSLIASIVVECPMWDVLCLQEVDHMHESTEEFNDICEQLKPHVIFRHYGGEGNRSLAIVLNSNLARNLKAIHCESRSMSIILQSIGKFDVQITNIHGFIDQDPVLTISEVRDHFCKGNMPESHPPPFLQGWPHMSHMHKSAWECTNYVQTGTTLEGKDLN